MVKYSYHLWLGVVYLFLQLLFISSFYFKFWLSFFVVAGYFCLLFFYHYLVYRLFFCGVLSLLYLSFVWIVGGLVSFSWLLFIDISYLDIAISDLLVGWLVLVLASLVFNLLFFGFFLLGSKCFRPGLLYFLIFFLLQPYLMGKYFFLCLGQRKGYYLNNPFLPAFSLLSECFLSRDKIWVRGVEIGCLSCVFGCGEYLNSQILLNKLFNLVVSSGVKREQVWVGTEAFLLDCENSQLSDFLAISKELPANVKIISGLHFLNQGRDKSSQSLLVFQDKSFQLFGKRLLCPWYEESCFAAEARQTQNREVVVAGLSYDLLLCSEFFLQTGFSELQKKRVVVLAKTKTFPVYFQKMLLSQAIWHALFYNSDIIWADENGLRIINFSDKFSQGGHRIN